MIHVLLTLLLHSHVLAVAGLNCRPQPGCTPPSYNIAYPHPHARIRTDEFNVDLHELHENQVHIDKLCQCTKYLFVIATLDKNNPCKFLEDYSDQDARLRAIQRYSRWWHFWPFTFDDFERGWSLEEGLPAVSSPEGLRADLILFGTRKGFLHCSSVNMTFLPPGRDTGTSSPSDSESDSDGSSSIPTGGHDQDDPTPTTTSLLAGSTSKSDTATTSSTEEGVDQSPTSTPSTSPKEEESTGEGDKVIEDEDKDEGDNGPSPSPGQKVAIGVAVGLGVPILSAGIYWLVRLMKRPASAE